MEFFFRVSSMDRPPNDWNSTACCCCLNNCKFGRVYEVNSNLQHIHLFICTYNNFVLQGTHVNCEKWHTAQNHSKSRRQATWRTPSSVYKFNIVLLDKVRSEVTRIETPCLCADLGMLQEVLSVKLLSTKLSELAKFWRSGSYRRHRYSTWNGNRRVAINIICWNFQLNIAIHLTAGRVSKWKHAVQSLTASHPGKYLSLRN